MLHTIHAPVKLDASERDYCKSMLEDVGLTEDEAEMMLDDFEAGY